MMQTRFLRRVAPVLLAGIISLVTSACSGGDEPGERTLRIYTTVTQETVDAVVAGFEEANPDVTVEVFRAPTGELTARIATELRDGDMAADVLWLTDPLSIQQYDSDGLLRSWQPENADAVPADFKTSTFFGTRILNMVIVAGTGIEVTDWQGLERLDRVAIPDPGFAGSAFGALAYFAFNDGYGLAYYSRLRANGAVQVNSPGDVVTGVAEGIYDAGMTLDFSARAAASDGSPVRVVWPDSGAIAIYSPIAVVATSGSGVGEPFVEFVLGEIGQAAIAGSGWQPVRADIEWESGGDQVSVDWDLAFDRQEELLGDYRAIFEN